MLDLINNKQVIYFSEFFYWEYVNNLKASMDLEDNTILVLLLFKI